jgi:DNA/RNA endonuclease YhcR with UshA esterase domain
LGDSLFIAKRGKMQIMDSTGKVVIVCSLLGVCTLYGVSLLIEPPYVPLNEVAEHETAFIRTGGTVTDFSSTESGSIRINIHENNTELWVFVNTPTMGKKELDLCYGDEIEVEGKVELYKGRYEIITHIEGIRKQTRESNISFVSQIATHPTEYEGTRVSVVGYVEEIHKRVFYLGDGRYRMRVVNDRPVPRLSKGDKIIVVSVLVYNAADMRYDLNLISLKYGHTSLLTTSQPQKQEK